MFEKLKEYWLYIIIWLIALWALAVAYLSLRSTQEWQIWYGRIYDWLLSWIAKSDSVKKITTLADYMKELDWYQLWEYQLSTSKVFLTNWNWEDMVWDESKVYDWGWWREKLYIDTVTNTTQNWKLWLYILLNKKLAWNPSDYLLESKKMTFNSTTYTPSDTQFKEQNMLLKWFVTEWYLWLWSFSTLEQARDFRDKFFSNWYVLQSAPNTFAVFFPI